jgi:hypothetical protein
MHVVHSRGDKVFRRLVTAGALTSLVVLGLIGAFLFGRGAQVFSQYGLKFITGTNATGAKIPMTTPVFFRGTNDTERMSFVMPPEMSVGAVPSPSDKMVQVSERPQGTFAVMPIGTKRARPYLESMVQKLEAALEETEWKSVGSAEFAYYDPPWIPAWFCRNECLIPVAKKKH